MPIQVNYYSKIIFITSPTTTVTVQELVDAIRAAEDTPEGASFGGQVATLVDAVIDAEGKADVGGGFQAGVVMTLKSDWYIEFWDGVVLGTVSGGNVTGGLANRPVRCAVGSSDTALQLGAVGGVIAETGVSGLTSEESTELFSIKTDIKGADDDDLKDISDQLDVAQADLDNPDQYKADVSGIASDVWSEDLTTYTTKGVAGQTQRLQAFRGRVSLDVTNGEAGTSWPVGTHRYPVNNLADALTIAAAHNLDIFWIHGAITIGASDNVDGFQFEGHSGWGSKITFTAGCSANQTSYTNIELDGEVSVGDVLLVQSCTILDLINFTGVMNLVAFADNSSLHIDAWASLINCNAGGQPTNEPEIDLNTSATTINGWNGNIKLKGKTGSNRTVVNLMAGNIIIDSTCTAGSIQLMGAGYLEADNSGAGCSLDDEGFISVANVSFGVWEEQVDDHGATGTTGKKLKDISSGVVFSGLAVGSGTGNNQVELPAAASSVDGAYDPALIAIVGGTGVGQCRGIFQYDGSTKTATVDRSWKVLPSTDSEVVITAWPGREHVNEGLAQGGTANTMTLNVLASADDDVYVGQSIFIRSGTGEDQVATITAYDGTTKIATVTPDWQIIPDSTSGYVMLPFRYLTATQTAEAVWNAQKAVYNQTDSMGEILNTLGIDLNFIKDIEGGRWKIENNQMIFYKDDNITEVARFNLYDADGTPAETDVFERERV